MIRNKINHTTKFGFFLFFFAALISCTQSDKESNTIGSIIPQPQTVTSAGKKFLIKESTGILIESGSEELKSIANYLAAKIKPSTGYNLSVSAAADQTATGNILITTSGADAQLGEEG